MCKQRTDESARSNGLEKRHLTVWKKKTKTKKKPLKGGAGVKGQELPAGCKVAFFLWFIQSATGGGIRGRSGVKEVSFWVDRKKEFDREMGR